MMSDKRYMTDAMFDELVSSMQEGVLIFTDERQGNQGEGREVPEGFRGHDWCQLGNSP